MSEEADWAAPAVQASAPLASDVRVFVSHNMEEAGSLARRLVADLEALGADCWTASRDIPAGQQWITAINEAFAQSTHVLVLVGRDKPTRWVRHEAAMALDRQIREEGFEVIPVVFEEGAQLTDGLQVSQAVDIVTDYAAGLRRLAARLGLEDALSPYEGRLLATWEEGLTQLRRQSEPLRRQLVAVREAVEAERVNADQGDAEADAAVAAAKSARARAAELEGQARNAATEADMAAEAAAQATSELQRARTVVAELSRRLVELEASYSPILTLLEQGEELLRTAQRSGPLNVDRAGEVVTLLEDPAQLPTAVDVRDTTSLIEFFHRHQITAVMLTAIQQRMTEDSPERDFVFSRCIQAMTSELPLSLELSEHSDSRDLQELGTAIGDAIDRYLPRKDIRDDAVARFDGDLARAFVRYVTRNAKPSQGLEHQGQAGVGTISPAPPTDTRFDVILTGVADAIESRTLRGLIEAVIGLMRSHPEQPTNASEIIRVIRRGPFPSIVLVGVDEKVADEAGVLLRSFGAQVSVRPSEDAP